MKEEKIRHQGVVYSIEKGYVEVLITQSSACAGCGIKSQCHSNDKKERLIRVQNCVTEGMKVGDKVVVSTLSHNATKVLLIAFGVPLIVILGALLIAFAIGYSENQAGIIALLTLIPYYVILYFFRNKIGKSIVFEIER